jgi:hypothetical protein
MLSHTGLTIKGTETGLGMTEEAMAGENVNDLGVSSQTGDSTAQLVPGTGSITDPTDMSSSLESLIGPDPSAGDTAAGGETGGGSEADLMSRRRTGGYWEQISLERGPEDLRVLVMNCGDGEQSRISAWSTQARLG